VKFPSGERPRKVSRLVVGGAGRGSGAVPTAVVDEVSFSDTKFGRGTPGVLDSDTQGATLVLVRSMSESDASFEVMPKAIRIPGRTVHSDKTFLSDLPADAGLLRMGEEILAYEERNADTGVITVAGGEAGRGLFGTAPQPHSAGEPVVFLEYHAMTALAAPISPEEATIRVKDLRGLPRQGTVLIGSELVHYTRHRENALEMPRFSRKPGAADESGAGVFRGRFGTTPQAHPAGAPVLFFPARYWDRWADRADVPELSFFTLEMEQPAAFWRALFWEPEQEYAGGPRLGCLVRTDPSVPWDADPEETDGLALLWQGTLEGDQPVPIGKQADRIELRVFVDYPDRAFDLETGAGHAWRQTPRLGQFGFFFIAPPITLASRER
jgi:hypothetical protein